MTVVEVRGNRVRLAFDAPDQSSCKRPGVARKLQDNPTTAKARLIAVTAYGQDEDRRRSQEAGFDHHLVKPVDPNALMRLLVSLDRKG